MNLIGTLKPIIVAQPASGVTSVSVSTSGVSFRHPLFLFGLLLCICRCLSILIPTLLLEIAEKARDDLEQR
jgi:hypothetical protein